ncbi:MAG TPA: choice-of-anchor Q domain-containing protein [Solirubrobacteraceae bacterium]
MTAFRQLLASCVVLACLAAPGPAGAATFVVNVADDPDPAAAPCQGGPCSLRGAVVAANADALPDTVVLPAGPIALSRNAANDDSPTAEDDDLDVTAPLEVRGTGLDATTITGADGFAIFGAPNTGAAPATQLKLSALTLAGAVAPGLHGSAVDGVDDLELDGVRITGMGGSYGIETGSAPDRPISLTIRNSIFDGNATTRQLVYVDTNGRTEVSVADSVFEDNTVEPGTSGTILGLAVSSGSPTPPAYLSATIDRSTFQRNTAAGGGFGPAEIVSFSSGSDGTTTEPESLTIRDTTFAGNRTTSQTVRFDPFFSDGGRGSSALTIERSRFLDNRSSGPFTPAGAVRFAAETHGPERMIVRDSVFAGNVAADGGDTAGRGGAIAFSGEGTDPDATLQVVGTTFDGNRTGNGSGGAVWLAGDQTAAITNSTFRGNVAGGSAGGALAVAGGSATLTHVTLTDGAAAAAAAISADAGAGVEVANSVLSDNGAGACAGAIVSAGGNVDHGGGCLGGSPDVDPLLGALADNGGPTPTRLPQPGSPLLDAATADRCPPADQRGVTRPQGTACDVGAVEVAVAPPPPPPPPPGDTGGTGGPGPGPVLTPPPPAITPPASEPLLLSCSGRRLALVDVVRSRGKVRITGQAVRALAGRRVGLFVADRRNPRRKAARAGRATVRSDGDFAATLPRPPRGLRSPEYFARAGGAGRSQSLELDRRMYADRLRLAGGRITFKGHVTRPLPKRGRRVTVTVQTGCRERAKAATARLDRRGRFTARFGAPTGVTEILVRAQSHVPDRAGRRARFRTFTLPRPLRLQP